jgi:AraC-like DNA-binding protein
MDTGTWIENKGDGEMAPNRGNDQQSRSPLDNCALYRGTDIQQVGKGLETSFGAHRLNIIGTDGFAPRHHCARGTRISVNFIEFGTRVLLALTQPKSFILALFPMAGGASVNSGAKAVYCHEKWACILGSNRDSTMIWGNGCRLILVRIEKTALLEYLNAPLNVFGRNRTEELGTFHGGIDLTCGSGARLRRLVMHLVAEIKADARFLSRPGAIARHLEDAVLAAPCECCDCDITPGTGSELRQIIPGKIRRAELYMHAHIDRQLSLARIAEATNVGERSLQAGFRRYHDMSPMQYLRTARLQHIHEELSKGVPGETVTHVAERWGISHLGRFSKSYRELYGCLPSDTLHNARDRGFMT